MAASGPWRPADKVLIGHGGIFRVQDNRGDFTGFPRVLSRVWAVVMAYAELLNSGIIKTYAVMHFHRMPRRSR